MIGPWYIALARPVVPAHWRDDVTDDLTDEARLHGRSPQWLVWQLLRVGVTMRWSLATDSVSADVRCAVRSLAAARWFTVGTILTFMPSDVRLSLIAVSPRVLRVLKVRFVTGRDIADEEIASKALLRRRRRTGVGDRKATICLLSLAATFITAVSVAPQTRALAITRVNVIDVVDGRIVPNSTVTIRGKTIVSVAQNSGPPGGAQIVDGQGKFVIPGLWDMHAHMEMTGESSLQLYVANGVTGIRDMGSALDFILNLREATSSGRTLGPQIVAAGPILDDAPGDWPLRMRVRTPDEGRAAVQLLKRRGVDLIKVHNYTPRDVFFAIADEARQQKLPVAGHVPLKVTIQEGVDAGMVSIEHLSEDGRVWKACSGGSQYRPDACRSFFEMLARRRVWQTPTLLALAELPVIGTPASAISRDQMAYANKRLLEMHAGNQSFFVKNPEVVGILKNLAEVGKVVTRDMAMAGVGILAGCDAMIAGFCVHDELAAMVAGGMMPLAALQTATVNPARYLGRESTLGTVAAGRQADLVLLDANPLEEIGNVRRIRAVITAGRFFDRTALDQLLARAKAAAQQ